MDSNGNVLTRICLDLYLKNPKNVLNAEIHTSAFDVDYPDEKDIIYLDGDIYRNLFGYPSMRFMDIWNDIPLVFFDDKKLNVFLDIDSEHLENYWGVQILNSYLTLEMTAEKSPSVTFQIFSLKDEICGLSDDIITQPGATDQNGYSYAFVETRNQHHYDCVLITNPSYTETIIRADKNEDIFVPYQYISDYVWNPGTENSVLADYLPAKYENHFKITCYFTPLQSDYDGHCKTYKAYNWCDNIDPPSKCYDDQFMKAVKRQGSGKVKDNEII